MKARIQLGIEVFQYHALPGVAYSATELAPWYGCSEARVREIVEKALRKLRVRLGPEYMEQVKALLK